LNYQTIGLPLWRYSVVLDYMRIREKISLSWWRPSEIFGLYDTSYPAGDDGGIVEWVNDGLAQKIKGSSPVLSGSGDESMEALRGVAESFYAASEKIADAVPVRGRSTRGRRR
jgi:hypothetical protein